MSKHGLELKNEGIFSNSTGFLTEINTNLTSMNIFWEYTFIWDLNFSKLHINCNKLCTQNIILFVI